MKTIFFSMLRQILKLNAMFLAIALATGTILTRLGWVDVATGLGTLLLGMVFIGVIETSRKLSLLLSFPYSRNRMIILTGSLHLFGGIASGICVGIYYLVALFYWQGKKLDEPLLKVLALEPLGQFSLREVFETPPLLTIILIGVSVGVCYLFSTSNSQNWGKGQHSVFSPQDRKAKAKVFFALYGFVGISAVIAVYSTFLMLGLIIAGINLFTAAIVSTNWVFSPARRRRWILSAAAFTMLQVSLLLLCCLSTICSGDASDRILTTEFLGIVGPKVDADFIRAVVARPIERSTAEKLVHLVGPKTARGKYRPYLWDAVSGLASYREMIANQVDYLTLDKLLSIYNPGTLTEPDFTMLMKKDILGKKGKRWQFVPGFWQWLAVPLTDELVLSYLRSKDEPKIGFALQYIAYHPAEKFLGPVLQGLRKDFPGTQIPKAVWVLSSLTGQNFDLRTYQAALHEGKKIHFEKIDCAGQGLEQLLEIKEESKASFFNRCIREAALTNRYPSALVAVDNWFLLPLKKDTRHNLEKAFRANR